MAKFTVVNKFGIIPNILLNNPKMTLKSKGLFGYLQSKPENWDFSADRIKFDTKESRDAILSGLKELENFGFLKRIKTRNNKGFWEMEYFLYDTPFLEEPKQDEPKQENPTQDSPTTNKKRPIKKEINKKEIIKKEFSKFEIEAAKYFIQEQQKNEVPTFEYLINKNGLENFILKNAAAVEKLKRLDKLSEDTIRVIIEFGIRDDFWNKNFRGLDYLRKKNKENIPYHIVFLEKAKLNYNQNKQYEISTI